MITGLFYHDAFLEHDAGPGHPERPERLIAVMEFLHQRRVIDDQHLKLITPQPATIPQLERVHPKSYIDLIHTASEMERRLDPDTHASKGSWNAALLAAGAGIHAWEEIRQGRISNAFALIRPPGHHAGASQARGFCLFNNIVITARHITETTKGRVLIVDIDAHHGNGTQEILYRDPNTLYLGLHEDGRWLYPGYSGYPDELGEGLGEGYNVNLPLPPGTTDHYYLQALNTILPPLAEQYQPTAILVSAGYDAHHRDYLTHLRLTATGYYKIAQTIMETANKTCKGHVIMFLEGGYDLQALSHSIYNTLIPMTGNGTPIKEPPQKEDPRIRNYITGLLATIRKNLKPWWKIPPPSFSPP